MKFKIKKDGKECEVEMKETKNGMKMKTKGSQCRRIMGKDYFKDIEFEMEDFE